MSDLDGRNTWMFGADQEAKAWGVEFIWNALNSLAQLVLGIRARRSELRRQTVEFRCVGQGRLQRLVEAPSETLQIERRRICAMDTNALALVRSSGSWHAAQAARQWPEDEVMD